MNDTMCKDVIIHDFPSLHISSFLFGDNVRKDQFDSQGNEFSDDFVDDIA